MTATIIITVRQGQEWNSDSNSNSNSMIGTITVTVAVTVAVTQSLPGLLLLLPPLLLKLSYY